MALSVTWGGRADTNVAFTEFFGADHTVAVRFMIQFANIYEGPMLAVHGSGTYFIGVGDGSAGNNKIAIRIGSGSLELPIAQTFQGSWHHVAVVRSGTIGTVYLDGASKGTLALPASGQPSGTLRMKVGGKARLVCPSDLAYGDRGNDDIPGGAALVFDIELLDVVSPSPRAN